MKVRKAILSIKPRDMLELFLDEYSSLFDIDVEKARVLIRDGFRYYVGDKSAGLLQRALEAKWYSSFDFSIYDDDYYFTDVYVCWILYSRKYIMAMRSKSSLDGKRSPFDAMKGVRTVVDLGCGIGYATAALKSTFRDAKVYGTNIEGTKQFKFCQHVGKRYGFNVLPDLGSLDSINLVFASEYFEHFEQPFAHLREVLKKRPRYLVIANSFNTYSMGHYTAYKHGNKVIPQESASKIFNSFLASAGYEPMRAKLWNNKPRIWVKAKPKRTLL